MNTNGATYRQQVLLAIAMSVMLSVSVSTPGSEALNATERRTYLLDQLEFRGWRAQPVADESLTSTPSPVPPAVPSERVAEQQAAESQALAETPQDVDAEKARAQAFIRQLEAYGWRVERDSEGNTLAIPLATQASSAPGPAGAQPGTPTSAESAEAGPPSAAASADTQAAADDAEVVASGLEMTRQLEKLLSERGWQVKRDERGWLVATPTAPSLAGAETTAETPTQAPATVMLPIDTEQEARRVSEMWLAANRMAGFSIGEIHSLEGMYVVSIVDQGSPDRVRNQLVIRTVDGRATPVY